MEASCQGSSKPMGQQQHEEEDEKINICVKMIETLSLQISKFETVGELKALVYEQEGKPELHQQLFFKGNHLRNDKTRLFDYGIRSNNTVIAHIANSNVLSLIIEIPSREKVVRVEGKPQDTVQNIKALIEASENMGSVEYSLVYGGKVLEEEKILALLGITNRSRLYVVLNPKDVIQVSVKMLNNGETVKTQVRLLHTILDVRSFVESVVVNSVVGALRYGGKKLDDSKTVSYYNIEDGSVLEELPRLD
nr:polyubiquitin-like isoform X1 [Ipomoea batatas]